MMAFLPFLGVVFELALLLFKEYFSAQAKARAANEKFILDQATLKKLMDSAVNRWVQNNAEESAGQGNAWDHADEDIGGPPKSDPPIKKID